MSSAIIYVCIFRLYEYNSGAITLLRYYTIIIHIFTLRVKFNFSHYTHTRRMVPLLGRYPHAELSLTCKNGSQHTHQKRIKCVKYIYLNAHTNV